MDLDAIMIDDSPVLIEERPLQFDAQQYCICRRGDDGLLFMIECDSCKEWFHGQCVGIYDDMENAQSQSQYLCIGCARVFYDYDPT